jgi:hypothetical protein
VNKTSDEKHPLANKTSELKTWGLFFKKLKTLGIHNEQSP